MNYYNEIKINLINNETYKKVKDYSKNRSDLNTYYNVGKLLVEAGKHYGEGIINEYSKRLTKELGKKVNQTTLKRIRQFYLLIEKGATLSHQLLWSQYVELIPLDDIEIINYYINKTIQYSLTVRQLRNLIKNKEYERLPIETRCKLVNKEKTNIKELIPNPILLKRENNIEVISERVLHQLILEDIQTFMKELGGGYSFISSEYKIKIGDKYNYKEKLIFQK